MRRASTLHAWLRRLLSRLLLALAALAVTLLVLEIVLRTTHVFGARVSWSMPDTLLAYRFAPHSDYWYRAENDHAIRGRINSWGWRDRDWTLAKPPGTRRVAVLGDSYIEAFQVESDSTFLRRIERMLAPQLAVEVEVMNFGRSGFTQTEEFLILETDVLRFEPDVVVLCFLPGNDITDVLPQTAPLAERPFLLPEGDRLELDTSFRQTRTFQLKARIDPLKRRSALVSLAAERYTLLRAAQSGRQADLPDADATPAAARVSGVMSLCTQSPEPALAASYAWNKRLITEIADVCRRREVALLLVCLNTLAHAVETEAALAAADSTFDAFFFERDLEALADSLGVEFAGLQAPMRNAHQAGRQVHWVHWSYEGHRVVAATLTPVLWRLLHDRGS